MMSETGVIAELGRRARQYRVGMTAGVSRRTIERLEAGSSVQLDKIVRILRALQLSANLDQLIPEASIRPIQLAGSKVEIRHRSYKRRNAASNAQGWVWGDKR